MNQTFSLNVNGKLHAVEADPDMPLLYALRNDIGLNNPHFGCGLAQCGACTVHLDGQPIALLRDAALRRRQRQDRHARGPRHARKTPSAADGLCRRTGAAMRLLYQRLDHDRGRLPARQEEADRRRDPRRAFRTQMPLRHPHVSILRAVKRAAAMMG